MHRKSGRCSVIFPAAASFDLFDNYQQRGELFIEFVSEIKNKTIANTTKPTKKCVIFDSGKGGAYIAKVFAKYSKTHPLLPEIAYETVLDTDNVPYGSHPAAEIRHMTETALSEHLGTDAIIVLACNTATAYAIDYLREKYPNQQFVGFEPMIKPAARLSETAKICVLATPATLHSERYKTLKNKFTVSFQVFEPDCSDWARLIENNEFRPEHLQDLLEIVKDNEIDQVILACTHYIAVKDLILDCVPADCDVLEPSEAVFRRMASLVCSE